jgi:hypothetical protein
MSTAPIRVPASFTNIVGVNDISPSTATTRLVQMPRSLYIDRESPAHHLNQRPPALTVVRGDAAHPPIAGLEASRMRPLVVYAPPVEYSTTIPAAGDQNVGDPERYQRVEEVELDLTRHFFTANWIRSATKLHWTEVFTDIHHYINTTRWCNNVLSVNFVIAKFMKNEVIIKSCDLQSRAVNVETIMPLLFQLACIHMTGREGTNVLRKSARKIANLAPDVILDYSPIPLPRFAWCVFGLEFKLSGIDPDTLEYLAFPHPVTGAPDVVDNIVPLEVRLSYNRMISNPYIRVPLDMTRQEFLTSLANNESLNVSTTLETASIPEPLGPPPPTPPSLVRSNASSVTPPSRSPPARLDPRSPRRVSFSSSATEVVNLGTRPRSPRIIDSSRRVVARRVGSRYRPVIIDDDSTDDDPEHVTDSDATEAYESDFADSDFEP